MFNQPSIAPLGESKSDTEIMTMLAQRTGVEQYWTRPTRSGSASS